MNKLMLAVVLVILVAMAAMAQAPTYTTNDVLGAHNVYGRGCVACHAPHGGARGNGSTLTGSGQAALWGEDLTPLYGKTLAFGDAGAYTVTLPANQAAVNTIGAHDPTFVIIACLSCHDGNVTKVGMMQGITVEQLPVAGGYGSTFLGADGNYNNEHPVGPQAIIGCGGSYNWDCAVGTGTGTKGDGTAPGDGYTLGTLIAPAGSKFAQFQTNYGFTVSPSVIAGQPTVTCTTCHDQHSMTIWNGTIGGVKANWNTSFFVRGPYTPGGTSGSTAINNTAAQFCRNCHGGESNEMHGLPSIPTVGATHQ
jgi:cytochrome c553